MTKNFSIGFLVMALSLNLAAQPLRKTDLAKKQQSIKEDIKKLNSELSDVRLHKTGKQDELSLLQQKIELREQSVEYNRQQINAIDDNIDKLENENAERF